MTDDACNSGAPIMTTYEGHVEKVKSVLECTHSISPMAIPTEFRIYPACVYQALTNSMVERKF
jgi:hypothetical protein